ncbi:MAG: ATP:cob(I)alamin adenosyltransferase [Gammaproteobacteria bacterium HGW-Gammaproteobacteria-14]|nr:MAG: ATP:cob(I)alamin adenosyltransferase [Gammaproteobacteria bacterium HGW-Gammaproteobacteria-14]
MTDKHRINRVITRSGDQGETGLADGSRPAKDAAVIEAMGAVDELSAHLGLLRVQVSEAHSALLETVQQRLFEVGAELAVPGTTRLLDEDVLALEAVADSMNAELPPLKEFVLAGGHPAAAQCHLCRTVARRAERRLVSAQRQQSGNPVSLRYLNRLSDMLFLLARTLNREQGVAESQWLPR